MYIDKLLNILNDNGINYKLKPTRIPIAYNLKNKSVIDMDVNKDNYADIVLQHMNEKDSSIISKTKIANKLMYSEVVMMQKHIPLVLFLLYCEGFTNLMQKANIKYQVYDLDNVPEYDTNTVGDLWLTNKCILWEREPKENSILLNGLAQLHGLEMYSYEELNSKDTYIDLLCNYYEYSNMAYNLDQYKDFMIDEVSKEVLMDYNLPTELTDVLLYANKLLTETTYKPENNLINLRVRSNEIISQYVYNEITKAYGKYRKSQYKNKSTKISVPQDAVIKAMKTSQLVEDSSSLNPILELEKNRSVTYKGDRGINIEKAFSIDKRAYDDTMIGVIGISTTPDAGVGILRQLTLEPNITSTRGYIDVTPMDKIDDLNSANLLTPAEMLTPGGVMHDDGQRTAMAYKQSKYMLLTEGSSPVLIGNKVESAITQHMSKDFIFTAEQDGEVIDIKNNIMIIKYADGKFASIDLNPEIKKNASSGFFIETQMTSDLKIGDKFKKGEVIANNPLAFTKDKDSLSASMNLGVLSKVAIVANYDIYEDSTPVTQKMANRMASTMIMDKPVTMNRRSYVEYIVKIGDTVNVGDPLIRFDQTPDDDDVANFFASLRETMKDEVDELKSAAMTTVSSKYHGTIADIKIYTTVDIEDLSESLQKIVTDYHKRIKKTISILNKYRNPDDNEFYKCGQMITESPEVIKPDYRGMVKGEVVNDGVLIIFYIKFKDIMKKGDKLSHYSALKGICSHVIKEGQEPYSEYRPDEEVSTIIAPGALLGRKVSSVIPIMFGNKLLIEAKRHLKKMYLDE